MTDTTLSAAVPEGVGSRFKALAERRGVSPSSLLRELVTEALSVESGRGPVEAATHAALEGLTLDRVGEAKAAVARRLASRLDQGAPSAAQTAAQLTAVLDGLRALDLSGDEIGDATRVPDEPFDPNSI